MRRTLVCSLLALLAASLLGCGNSGASDDSGGKTPPPMPGGMGEDGRPKGPAPEDSAK